MTDDYVSNDAWLVKAARPDTIDEIADEFERPSWAVEQRSGRTSACAAPSAILRLARRTIERRAG